MFAIGLKMKKFDFKVYYTHEFSLKICEFCKTITFDFSAIGPEPSYTPQNVISILGFSTEHIRLNSLLLKIKRSETTVLHESKFSNANPTSGWIELQHSIQNILHAVVGIS